MDRLRKPLFFLALTAGSLLLGFGCGKKGIEGPVGKVSGKITFKGSAIPEGCVVVFTPKKGSISATGKVDGSGSFTLYYNGATSVPVGSYSVNISLPVVNETPKEAMERMQKKEKPKDFSVVPEKYRKPTTSGQTFEVKEGDNTYNLDMKPK